MNDEKRGVFLPCLQALSQHKAIASLSAARSIESDLANLIPQNHVQAVNVLLRAGCKLTISSALMEKIARNDSGDMLRVLEENNIEMENLITYDLIKKAVEGVCIFYRQYLISVQGKTTFFSQLHKFNKYLNSDKVNQYYSPSAFKSTLPLFALSYPPQMNRWFVCSSMLVTKPQRYSKNTNKL